VRNENRRFRSEKCGDQGRCSARRHGRGPRPGDGDPRTQEKLAIIAGIGRKDKSPFPLELVTSAQINFSGHHVRMQMVLPWTVLLE